MKQLFYSICIVGFSFMACQKKNAQTIASINNVPKTSGESNAQTIASINIFPKTSWKSAATNKFPLYYQFTDSTTVLIRDDSGEIPNMYEATYKVEGDTIKLEVKADEGESGAMNGYKQTLFHKNDILYLVADQMPKQSKIDTYTTPDTFIKEAK